MEETNTDPSRERKSTPNMGILATAKLSQNWRKAVDAVRRTIQASKSATTKKAHPLFRSRSRSRGGPGGGVTCTNVTPEASQAARFTRAVNEAVYSPHSPHHGWAGRLYPGSGSRQRYRSVKVLLAFWAETDDPAFGAAAAAHALADVFRGRYGFDVLVWLIPVMQPQQALAAKLRQFAREVDHRHLPGEDLLIFWYGGSAREEEGGGRGPLWYGENFGGPTIDSQIVPQILGASRSDVLTLYDAPHALHGHNVTGPGVYEHLGASAHDDIIAGFVGEDSSTIFNGSRTPLSFTHALIQILDKPDRAARGIAVLDIHRKLVNRYQMAAAAVAADSRASESDEEEEEKEKEEAPPTTGNNEGGGHHYNKRRSRGENAYTTSSQPWLPRALRQTPVYCHLSRCRPRSEGGGPASIVLSQLGRPPPETFLEPRQVPPHGPEGVGGEKGENGDGDDGTAEVTMRMRLRAPADAADIGRWKEWILDAPPEASQLVFIQAKPT